MKTNLMKQFIAIAAALTFTLVIGAGEAHANLKDNNNGTITDTATGLVWLKNADCFGAQQWQTATNSAAGLGSGACGLTDKSNPGQWRLPTKGELKIRSANKAGFTKVQACDYWSSSSYDARNAWYVYMLNGYVSYGYKGNLYCVWPVRGGQ